MSPETVMARSAIESLRSGVPSRDAARQLGTTQEDVRARFEESLDAVADGLGAQPIVISATFGAGKTHLLNYLQTLAEQAGFVTSYVVVSPEMPLGAAQAVQRAIAEAATAPGHADRALRALTAGLRTDGDEYRGLLEWARTASIDDRFRALLRLYETYRADEEFRVQILGDFEGRGMLKTVIKGRLKQINEAQSFDLGGPRSSLLAHDRIRLLAQIYRAAGCKGWVVLFDEMERVAKFSLNQRLAAYSELGWWREAAEMTGAALLPVFTTASGFVQESVTGGTRDEDRVGAASDGRDRLARSGMEMLKSPIRLLSPTPEQESQIQYRVRSIYEEAYGQPAADIQTERGDVRTSIRSEIRRWITLWDLHRYNPDYQAEVAVDDVQFDPESISDTTVSEASAEDPAE